MTSLFNTYKLTSALIGIFNFIGYCCADRRNVYSGWSYNSRATYKVYIIQWVADLFNMVGGGQFVIIDAICWGKWKSLPIDGSLA